MLAVQSRFTTSADTVKCTSSVAPRFLSDRKANYRLSHNKCVWNRSGSGDSSVVIAPDS